MELHKRVSRLSVSDFLAVRTQLGAPGASGDVPPIGRASREERLPLSFAQERLWFIEQLGLVGTAYNMPLALRLHGALDRDALAQALGTLVERHESLRTHFKEHNGVPYQVIESGAAAFMLKMHDLREMTAEDRNAQVFRLRQRELEERFDLERGPLFRARLVLLTDEEHVLLLTMHHVVSDGWSLGVLQRELSALYDAFIRGDASPLRPLVVQYADYAVWQREWLEGNALQRQLSYWSQQLRNLSPLDLPTDRPRPAVATHRGAQVRFEVSPEVSATLIALAQSEGVTPFMVLLGAFQVLLSRYTGQSDIAVGSPTAGRSVRETEGLIGLFLNPLVLRTNLSGDPTFLDILARVKEMTLGAYANQDVPFERVVAELRPERDLARQPLFQVDFIFRNLPEEKLQLPGVGWQPWGAANVTVHFDLSVLMAHSAGRITGVVEYATDLFDRRTMARLGIHFVRLLETLAGDPAQRISDITFLGQDELRQILARNDTQWDSGVHRCVQELIAEQAARSPGVMAVRCGKEALTYRELDSRANRLARYLRSLGVGPEAIVGVCVPRSTDLIVAILGVLKAGAAYLPLDPRLPRSRIERILEGAAASVVLTQENWDAAAIAACPDLPPPVIVGPEGLAYVVSTSGSTGTPKLVGARHASLTNRILAQRDIAPWNAGESCYQKTPIEFVDAVVETLGPLCHGCCLELAPAEAMNDPLALIELLSQAQVRQLLTVPTLANELLRVTPSPSPLEGLRHWVLSGEALTAELLQRLRATLPRCRFVNLYGSSESGADSTCHVVPEEAAITRPVPIGRPIANTRVYVLDSNLAPVPDGVVGDVYVGGNGLARGYLGQPSLTAQCFIADPFVAGERMYRMGDRGRYSPDGQLEFRGRADHQVKIRGHRIELQEIEATLLHVPGVKEAVVVAREEESGDLRLAAYMVPAEGISVDVAAVRLLLRERLPDYMVPNAYAVVEALPRTSSGKVKRTGLPEPQRPHGAEEPLAPQTPVEQSLATIWSELLRIEKVGVLDNFFELGGHSLLGMRMIARIQEVLNVRLPIHTLFEKPTIRQLAMAIEPDGEPADKRAIGTGYETGTI